MEITFTSHNYLSGAMAQQSDSADLRTAKARENHDIAGSIRSRAQSLNDWRSKFGQASLERQRLRVLRKEIGRWVAKNMSSSTPRQILEELRSFWIDHGLGVIVLAKEPLLTFRVESCFCCHGEDSDNLLCPLKEGLVESVLTLG